MKRYIRNSVTDINNGTWDERTLLAQDPDAYPETLISLAKDRDEDIQALVASNPNTPISVLKELSSHPEEKVKVAITENPNVTPDILYDMAKNCSYNEYRLIEYLAVNPSTPTEALDLLLNKCIIDEWDYQADLPDWLAENPNISDDALVWLLDNDLLYPRAEQIAKQKLGKI